MKSKKSCQVNLRDSKDRISSIREMVQYDKWRRRDVCVSEAHMHM